MIAECCLPCLVDKLVKQFSNFFSLFFFACTKKKQKSAPGNDKQPIAGGYSGQHGCTVVKDFRSLICPTGNENSEYFDFKIS